MIWAAGIAVALLAVAGVLAPWWAPAFAARRGLKRKVANVTVYRTRLAEVEADVAAGVVALDAAEALRAEMAAHLVQDAAEAPAPEPGRRGSRAIPVLVAVALLALGAIGYAVGGGWRTLRLIELAKTDPEAAQAASVDQTIATLEKKVRDTPDDADSWAWLGRSYRTRERYADAARAFGRASAIKGEQDPDLLTEQGEALAFAQGRSMTGAPAAKFQQALALAPDHPQALWYAGIAALQAGDDRTAIEDWDKLSQLDISDDMRQVLQHSIARLRERAGIKAPPAPPKAAAAPAGGVAIRVKVDIAGALAKQVRPGDTLFVYAVDPDGPPMPLAVQRLSSFTFPLEVRLDDTMSPMPTRKLSSVARWRVVARVSRNGSAMPQPGDLEGDAQVSKARIGKPVQILIGQQR